jgi:FAD/FMN-containing dehydrogenase
LRPVKRRRRQTLGRAPRHLPVNEIRHVENQRRCRRASLTRSRINPTSRRNRQKTHTFVANFGHAGDGNIHVNFLCNRDDSDSIARARECVKETFALSVALGGSISGEHGIGYVKAAYLDMAIDAPTMEIMKGIKRVFDPNGILNPGKMFV